MNFRRVVAFAFGMWAAYILLGIISTAVPPRDQMPTWLMLIGIWAIGGCALYFGFPDLVGRARRRHVVICVTGEGLTVNRRRSEVLSSSDAPLGPWDFQVGGMTAGAALHLRRDAQSFVLGGRDHRIGSRTRLEAPPTDKINAWMWAADFAELRALIGPRHGWDIRGSEPGEPTRCLLVPKSAKGVRWPHPEAEPCHRRGRKCAFGDSAEQRCARRVGFPRSGESDTGEVRLSSPAVGNDSEGCADAGHSRHADAQYRMSRRPPPVVGECFD